MPRGSGGRVARLAVRRRVTGEGEGQGSSNKTTAGDGEDEQGEEFKEEEEEEEEPKDMEAEFEEVKPCAPNPKQLLVLPLGPPSMLPASGQGRTRINTWCTANSHVGAEPAAGDARGGNAHGAGSMRLGGC